MQLDTSFFKGSDIKIKRKRGVFTAHIVSSGGRYKQIAFGETLEEIVKSLVFDEYITLKDEYGGKEKR